jgi:hypothetical protein
MLVGSQTKQSEINERLRPWLDFAALLPCKISAPSPARADPNTIEQVFKEGASPELDDRNPSLLHFRKFPGHQLFRHRVVTQTDRISTTRADIAETPGTIALSFSFDRTAAAQVFYSLFFNVRWALEQIALEGAHQNSRELRGQPIGYDTSISSPMFGFPQRVEIRADGTSHIVDEPVWSSFKLAIEGVECQRVRRCSECGRVYYAVRFNKQACDLHLAVAAVKRSQRKRFEYENNRTANRLVQQEGMSIGEAVRRTHRTETLKRRKNDDQGFKRARIDQHRRAVKKDKGISQ